MRLPDSLSRWLHREAQPALPKSDREKVFANPERYTRAARRAVGYLKPVWAEAMRATPVSLPRSVRRHLLSLASRKATRRVHKNRARIARALRRRGMEVAW